MSKIIIKQQFCTKEAAKKMANRYRAIAPKAYITIRRGKTLYLRLRDTERETDYVKQYIWYLTWRFKEEKQ